MSSLNTRQAVKLLLAAAIFVVVFRMLLARSGRAMDRYEDDGMYYDSGAAAESYGEETYDAGADYAGGEEAYADGAADYAGGEEAYADGGDDYAAGEETYAPSSNAAVPMLNVSTDLLPKPSGGMTGGENWSEFAPKDALKNQNFLDATKFIGVNTQGSSLRNANYDLRSSMPIPKSDVGPWSGSSIDPDLMRRPLE
jgi:hypothetical protein